MTFKPEEATNRKKRTSPPKDLRRAAPSDEVAKRTRVRRRLEYSTRIRPVEGVRVGRLNDDMACFWEVYLELSVPGIKRSSSKRRQRGPPKGGEGTSGYVGFPAVFTSSE